MNSTSPKPFAFVIMPFLKEFDDIYQLGIKPACEKAGAYAERVDEQIFHESILQRIYNQISKADVIIADMTGRNPNVFYEAGYAHALGKPVILLTQAAEDIPFDLKHYPHIVYGGRITDLIPELVKRVTFAVEKPKAATEGDIIEVYVDGKSLRSNPNIIYPIKQMPVYGFTVKFDFYNSTYSSFRKTTFKIGFMSSKVSSVTERAKQFLFYQPYSQPDGISTLHLDSRSFNLLPGAWAAVAPDFRCLEKSKFDDNEIIELTLRIFTEEAPFDFPFTVQIASEKLEVESSPTEAVPRRSRLKK